MIALKGDHSYQPMCETAWAIILPIRFEFDVEIEAQSAMKIAKEILESPNLYKPMQSCHKKQQVSAI